MFSQEALETILGIEEHVSLKPEEMTDMLVVTFFPEGKTKYSQNIKRFSLILQKTFIELNVKVIPYEESLEAVPISKILKRFIKIIGNDIMFLVCELLKVSHNYHFIYFSTVKNLIKRYRIKKGISVIALGEGEVSKLPIDYTSSFTQSSIITILDKPKNIDDKTNFQRHFDTAMDLFAYHMTQIVILVDEKKWILYNFNASHPIYSIDENMHEHVLHALVPKLAAPMRPHRIQDIIIDKTPFDPDDSLHIESTKDLIEGGSIFDQTDLYPKGKKIDDLPFRNKFYRWIGGIHLDHRNGMSYGFIAKQLPTRTSELIPYKQFVNDNHISISSNQDFFIINQHIYIVIIISREKFVMQIPPVWVLTQRSGANKTHIDIHKDLLVLGLVDGKVHMKIPKGLKLTSGYKPSFDTRVILAHAVGNSIVASILNAVSPNSSFARNVSDKGVAIAHWHGYFHPNHIPKGWYYHGYGNPHVACSTSQSAIYALQGKLEAFYKVMQEKGDYQGDIHIEPQHGSNVVFTSVKDLAILLSKNPGMSVLGNKYLEYYH